MLWDRGHRSNDVIDNRGRPAMGGMGGGGGGVGIGILLALVRSKFGWLGVIVLVGGYFLLTSFGGGLPGLGGAPEGASQRAMQGEVATAPSDEQAAFIGFVLDDVQATWDRLSPIDGTAYQRTKLVLFTGAVGTACGTGQSATGPFYCPGDQRVYIDLGFYRSLKDRLGAPGDFAQAYVIAHEYGHHVQHLTGQSRAVQESGDREGPQSGSVRLELQADCYAGAWAANAVETGFVTISEADIQEGLSAAAAVGDDRIQETSSGRVDPGSWTHGSAEQRQKWFRTGLSTGDPNACDTFAPPAV